MMLLGLDVGDRRVGIACADTEVRIATPVHVVVRASLADDTRAIDKFVREYGASELVVGLPRNMDGTRGEQAEAVVAYAEKVGQALKLPVIFWDERLTTLEATRRVHATGARGTRSRRGLDAIAAAVILQDYMDAQGSPV